MRTENAWQPAGLVSVTAELGWFLPPDPVSIPTFADSALRNGKVFASFRSSNGLGICTRNGASPFPDRNPATDALNSACFQELDQMDAGTRGGHDWRADSRTAWGATVVPLAPERR